ncbi:glycogen/starch/alpha-glucan phosphorylase [Microvirga roseola]|uniref:glycogen/starch/alpha-glucan phosphorylase n=1 Tax=Microvirga roseola TaxID=2883126 RepID=UPI001E2D396C|nr:glycogen/starch/alpha-glucan phosphorylase [Microvirga roseola]
MHHFDHDSSRSFVLDRSSSSDQADERVETGSLADGATLALRSAILAKLTYVVGTTPSQAKPRDWFVATALAVRDRTVEKWVSSNPVLDHAEGKQVCYLSLEFLIGRLLSDTLNNLGLTENARAALEGLGVNLDDLRTIEPDAALGNGGLGRLAACFMESLASLSIPACGYGIRYEHGLFRQVIQDGYQQEQPEDWLVRGNPWEFERSDVAFSVGFGGRIEEVTAPDGSIQRAWRPAETVQAVAFDTPIVGWRGQHVNTLRLWSARAAEPLKLDTFNAGDHVGALADRTRVEAISRVLYPGDMSEAGRELRLRQEFFFTSASLQDLLARHVRSHGSLATLPEHAALQLNDTHPAIAVAELMRLLVDEHRMGWDEAWSITTRTLNYTNHTLMPEALERWPVSLMERLLPRQLEIIYHINWLHLEPLIHRGADGDFVRDVSIIDENGGRYVRMGHLAFIGAHKVNGVSALHTDLMRHTVFRDLNALYPTRIVNKTNGITFRRWLHQANPKLMRLLTMELGTRVLDDAEALIGLERLADDPAFQALFRDQRAAAKANLAAIVAERTGIGIDPNALFDVQIKRIHEYKRQLLNILEAVALYNAIKTEPDRDWTPRVKIFAGKAAPSYHQAKLIIKLANDVAKMVNSDPVVAGRLKVVFLPNYNVSLAEAIIPAADLSEQISTAGMEASGTGNMKLALNGALTIGTLDGANVEIREHVGSENIFIFGLTAEEVETRRRKGIRPDPQHWSERLKGVFDAIRSGVFSPEDPHRFDGLLHGIETDDPFMVAADFESYWETQRQVDDLWRDPAAWWRASILNTARTAWFSSDRTIREYAEEIWGVGSR